VAISLSDTPFCFGNYLSFLLSRVKITAYCNKMKNKQMPHYPTVPKPNSKKKKKNDAKKLL
jgi:hypothetical protein